MGNFTYQQLDPIGAMESGQRMAMNQMTIQDSMAQRQNQQQMQGMRQQAIEAPGGYNPENHKKLLMDAGYFEEAQDMDDLMTKSVRNKAEVMEKTMTVIERTAQMTQQLGAPAWDMLRSTLINTGMADEESLPMEYNEQAAQIAQNVGAKANDTFRLLHFRSGDKQQDIMNVGGQITKGDPYSPGSETAMIKNAKYLANIMDMPEEDAAQIMIMSKDKSDAAVYQDLYKTALKATYGDQEEATRMAREGLEAVRQYRKQPKAKEPPPPPAAGGGSGAQPVRRPGAEPKKLVTGKIYPDGNGNKARFKGGDPNDLKNWEPVP
jgi:hypothetical protein